MESSRITLTFVRHFTKSEIYSSAKSWFPHGSLHSPTKPIFNCRRRSSLKYSNVPGKVLMPTSKTSRFLPTVQRICSSLSSSWTSPKCMLIKTTNKSLTLATFVWREWFWEGIHQGGQSSKRLPVPSIRIEKEWPFTSCCQMHETVYFNKHKWFSA